MIKISKKLLEIFEYRFIQIILACFWRSIFT